jgi:hypothetical protein
MLRSDLESTVRPVVGASEDESRLPELRIARLQTLVIHKR